MNLKNWLLDSPTWLLALLITIAAFAGITAVFSLVALLVNTFGVLGFFGFIIGTMIYVGVYDAIRSSRK